MKKIIIAAVSKNNIIGKEGKLPWHNKEELDHFKSTTSGFPVLMGRKTWDALGKPLSNRLNLIISKSLKFADSGSNVIVFRSINDAIDHCLLKHFEKLFIIGGSEIFKQTINIADEIILSKMNFEAEGDKYFVNLDPDDWLIHSNEKFKDFEVIHYLRKS
ncbi:MAG: dihydrofolate reductase [Bacteroidota bacterium]